jgi:hypothetical protein
LFALVLTTPMIFFYRLSINHVDSVQPTGFTQYDNYIVPYRKHRCLTLWLFAWGGGLLTMGGVLVHLGSNHRAEGNVFVLDPADGW